MATNSKEYGRLWYEKNRVKVIARIRELERQRTIENRAWIVQLKESTPCAECGKFYRSCVMQFDHLGNDKIDTVSAMVGQGSSRKRIQKEIDKCELVCANCHAERTHVRGHAEHAF